MPNHCYNILKLTEEPGKTKEALKKFLSKDGKDEFFDFDKVKRMPKDLDITSTNPDLSTKEGKELKAKQDSNLKKYGVKDWYDWKTQNWGTKWNSYENYVQDGFVSFSTAWAPPIPIVAALAQKTKMNWTLLYSEPGMDFCGKVLADKSGELTEQQWSLKKSPKSFRREMELRDEDIYSEEELEERELNKKKKKVKKNLSKLGSKNIIDIDI